MEMKGKTFLDSHPSLYVLIYLLLHNMIGDIFKLAKMELPPPDVMQGLLASFYFISGFGNSRFVFFEVDQKLLILSGVKRD